MQTLVRGRYRARLAETPADVAHAQALRHRAFVEAGAAAPRPGGREADAFDAICEHVLIEEVGGAAAPVCCFRLLSLACGAEVGRSHAAQHYDLAALSRLVAPLTELGRFCIAPDVRDPDILRLAWGAIACHVDATGSTMLFGCSSFRGTDPAPYRAAFALLGARHLAPARWRPGVRAAEVVRFCPTAEVADPGGALRALPSLLRSYLQMGGRVGDHAVVDRVLNTLHVFTGLEVTAIPPDRARTLRAVAG